MSALFSLGSLTEAMVALGCEVQNHCREEPQNTQPKSGWAGTRLRLCLGADMGGQSYPHCAPR